MRATRDRILDTAERLFSEQGYSATSVRQIITKARVNLAAVHYHFRSKEALLEAVILRRAIPANKERLHLLDICEREAEGGSPALESILHAFLEPGIRAAREKALGGMVFMRLIGRLQAEGDLLARIITAHFLPVLQRFSEALLKALPGIPKDDLFWRIHFAIGAATHALRGADSVELLSGGLSDAADPQIILDRLVQFLSAGLRAPAAVHRHAGGTK